MTAISRWFIDNPIAAKIFMLVILLGGLFSFPALPKVFFPTVEINIIRVTVAYPGAGPAEVEKQITERIEEAIDSLGGIEEVRSTSREGFADVEIELEPDEDVQRLLNDVRANVDAITTFPASAERAQIVEQRHQTNIIRLQLAGDVSERELKELGEQIREELAALQEVDIAELTAARDYEVSVEISERRLIEYGIGFSEVANAIRAYSFDQPVGKIRDVGGDVQLQTRLQAESSVDFASIPVLRKADGSVIRVGDVAEVIDGFEDVDRHSQLDGRNSIGISIIQQSKGNILKTADAVKAYVASKNQQLPAVVALSITSDMSIPYRGRLDTLVKNGSSGLALVFLMLMMFLRPALAFWVCMGIAVAFLGAVWGLTLTPISLNIMSLFAFIMILGIVVDDAIIIGEAVHTRQQFTGSNRLGAIQGVQSMLTPVAFAVVSTIIFFVPFYFLSEDVPADNMATPVILALIFSLVESFFLLPSHLAHQRSREEELPQANSIRVSLAAMLAPLRALLGKLQFHFDRLQRPVSESLPRFAQTHYRRWMLRSVANKSMTLLVFLILFACSVAVVRGGWLPFYFMPKVTSDFLITTATLPESSAYNQSFELMQRIEKSAVELRKQTNQKYQKEIIQQIYASAVENTVFVMATLEDGSDRPVGSEELAAQWRRSIGAVYGVTELEVNYTLFGIPGAINFDVKGSSLSELQDFTAELLSYLNETPGVFDVRSSLEYPSSEINFVLNRNAESLALNMKDISGQIRQAFYGEEVQRIPRGREDVRVFVRYPRDARSYEEALTEMKILSPAGERIPLTALVSLDYQDSYKKIERIDGKRVARVSANTHRGFSAAAISSEALRHAAGELALKYPTVEISISGEEESRRNFFSKLLVYFVLAMLVIYGLIAVVFHSYWQPLLVLTAVPFGFMGAIFGHLLLGINMAMMSVLGMLACAGVVVNDNVVLIDRINQLRAMGESPRRAVLNAGIQRFRPIVLTSLTTFLGLTPILLETSVQAQFLIPMVTSLSFGVLFASTVTLLFIPCLYLSIDNLMRKLGISRGSFAHAQLALRSDALK